MNDAQTSGGLLSFVPQDKKERLVSALQEEGLIAAHIGEVLAENVNSAKRILVEK